MDFFRCRHVFMVFAACGCRDQPSLRRSAGRQRSLQISASQVRHTHAVHCLIAYLQCLAIKLAGERGVV